jgi:hypothetical protein
LFLSDVTDWFRLWLRKLVTGSIAIPDLDFARFHCFGHDAPQFNDQKTILQTGIADLDKIGQLEAALEGTRSDATVQEIASILFFGSAASDREQILLRDDLDLLWLKARDRQRNSVCVLCFADNVERWVAIGCLSPGRCLE